MQMDQVVLDLLERPSFQDAQVARRQIEKGKAVGSLCAVRFRAWEQDCLYRLGVSIHRKTHMFILPLLLGLGVLLTGFKVFDKVSSFDHLWVENAGRLEAELNYSASALGEAGSVVHLLIAQTAKLDTSLEVPQQRLIHRKALFAHLMLVKAAIRVTVNMYDVTWTIKDICLSPNPPDFENHYIDNIFQSILPCEIITPLDCFWEGSKILGPDHSVTIPNFGNNVKWTNLHPQNALKAMRAAPGEKTLNFPFDMLENYMKRAGINSGYQDKQCLDPDDPECPESAPNKKTKKIPDIGAELTNGCRGFASKYMNWPRDLMLGGISFNKSGQVQNAQALQSVIQLLGEKELFELWDQTYKVLHFSWDQQKAALVLKAWQKKFSEEVKKIAKNNSAMDPYNFNTFSTMLLNDLLSQYDVLDHKLIILGAIILIVYVCFMQINLNDAVRSQLIISLLSLGLVLLSVASGIAFCSLIGIQFHTATIFVTIAISTAVGVHNMFLLMFSYKRIATHGFDPATQIYTGIMGKDQVGMVLKSAGTNILMENIIVVTIFITAAVVPIPALRAFCLQVAILVMFVMVTSLIGITSLISFDVRRKRTDRIDVFCCFPTNDKRWPFLRGGNNFFRRLSNCFRRANTTDNQLLQSNGKSDVPTPAVPSVLIDIGDPDSDLENGQIPTNTDCWDCNSSIDFAQKYVNYLTGPCRNRVILLFIIVLIVSIWGIIRIQAGLTLPEMVPNGTNEQKFLAVYGDMFGFYNLYAVTKGDFEYPTNQKLLYEYHDAFMRVPNILKNDNGGLPQMWLTLFREWLLSLQRAFDRDWARNCISQEGWLTSCATESGILGYKLLVQTGNNDNPIDKALALSARLVNDNGIINEETFYNLLSAWASNDILAYGASQANIRPEPRQWKHEPNDYNLQIVKSSPITYAQMPFYASRLYDTSVITKFISMVRGICEHYDERGLPNYPSGIPFVYWEQYQDLLQYSLAALLFAFLFLFLISGLFLCNVRSAFLVVFMASVLVIQTLGFMGFAGIKFSAIPVVILIGSIGTGTPFNARLCLSFVTCIGNKHRRTYLSVDHMSKIILQSATTVIIAVILLAFQNNYVSNSYFQMIVANTIFGLFNGLVCLPVFLSMFGPPPEIEPLGHVNRISTPSPEPVRRKSRYAGVRYKVAPSPIMLSRPPDLRQYNIRKQHHQKQQANNSSRTHVWPYIHGQSVLKDGSLSTIAEESGSCHSASVNMETNNSRMSSRSPSPSIYSEYSTDSGSENNVPHRTQSVPSPTVQPSAPTRCVLKAKFELELDSNMMSASAQPCVHKSTPKQQHNNRESKRHKRHDSNRY